MSSLLPPPRRSLRDRIQRGDRTLGVRVETPPAEELDGIDFLIVPAPDGRLPAGAVRRCGPEVLAEVDSAAAAQTALRHGADGIVLRGPEAASAARAGVGYSVVVLVYGSHAPVVPAADAVLGPSGRGRTVDSPAAARAAFAAGATVVVVDLLAAVDRMVAEVAEARSWTPPAGERTPLVLLSGMLGDATLYDGVSAGLDNLVLPWPARIDRDDSVAEMAATVLAESPPVFVLAGHSLGGIVALEIMRQAPERVTGLVLLCSSARGPTEGQLAAWAQMRRRTQNGDFEAVAAELARATLAADRRGEAALVAANEQMAWTVGCEGFLRQLTAQGTRPDSLESVGSIRVPVLVVSGGRDEVCPPHLQSELAERCPTAEWLTIEDGGHMLPLERPAAVAAAIRDWMQRRGIARSQ